MYIAQRSFKVQGFDGVRLVQPGDPVPEADEWKNVDAYVKRQWICLEGQMDVSDVQGRIEAAEEKADKALKELAALKEQVTALAPSTEESTQEQPRETPSIPNKAALNKMGLGQLQQMAEELGLDPDQTKSKLASAISGLAEALAPSTQEESK